MQLYLTYFDFGGLPRKIDILLLYFAEKYYLENEEIQKYCKNNESVYLLSFALIILNYEIHEEKKIEIA